MLLIITGCIQVAKDTPYVVIKNTEERLQDYLGTIRWAIEETEFNDILFCDNSNYQLDAVKEIHCLKTLGEKKGKRFVYYSFQGNVQEVKLKGKGYGEGEILSYLYENSPIMHHYEYYYKITGRLTIQNISKIHLSDKAENLFIFDVGMRSVDTRFYKMRMKDYVNFFQEAYKKVNDSENKVLEYVYFSTLDSNRLPFGRFNRSLEFRGKSGSSGTEYLNVYHENCFFGLLYQSFLYKTYWGRKILKRIRRIKVK